MVDFFRRLFDTDFMPHIYCLRQPDVIWTHVISDILISASYFLIPVSLVLLVRKRKDLSFAWMFLLFGAFILSCGLTHVMSVWTLWSPVYRFEALVKGITALVSLPTAMLLIKMVPRAVALPSPAQLRVEIADRERAETEVRRLNAELEQRVADRTAALTETNRKLAESERRRLLAVEAAEMGTWYWDSGTGELFWDERCKMLYGMPLEETASYAAFISKVHPEDVPMLEAELRRTIETGCEYESEYRITGPQGTERWIRAKGCTDGVAFGSAMKMQGIAIDITERKRLELAALRLAAIVESSADAIISSDPNGVITSWNRGAEQLFGYTAEEAMGKTVSLLAPAGSPDEIPAVLARVLRREAVEHFESIRRRKDGEEIVVSLAPSAIYNTKGSVVGISQIARDITERKRLDRELAASEQRFRTVAEAVPEMLFSTREDDRVTFMNVRFQDYSGIQLDNNPGESIWRGILHPDDYVGTVQAWRQAAQVESSFESECRLKAKDGSYRWFVVRAAPLQGYRDRHRQWIGACTEIDYLKRTEQALRRSNDELQQFAYAAAHDLQEPLRNIVNAAGTLSVVCGGQLDDTGRMLVRECIDGGTRMHGMVRDLLAYSTAVEVRAGAGKADSNEVMATALENLSTAIAEAGAEIQYQPLPEVPVDKAHLLHLFQNLIGNALKYRRPDRPPIVKIEAMAKTDHWLFSVADNGIGFDPKYSDQIFRVFKRLHNKNEYSGTGIGLAICARIISFNGGRIWAKSEPGEGATFYFTLPFWENTK